MTLQERIMDDLKASLKEKDAFKKNLLGVVIAEATRYNKEASDIEVIKVIKKQIDSAKLCHTEKEIPLLEVYLPKELTDDELKHRLQPLISDMLINQTSIGDTMKTAKSMLGSDFDGKRVLAILKTL